MPVRVIFVLLMSIYAGSGSVLAYFSPFRSNLWLFRLGPTSFCHLCNFLVVLIRNGSVSCDFWHNSVLSMGFPDSFAVLCCLLGSNSSFWD